ncbi:putative lipase atg15 [Marasmius tenuissimus]|nr:putative lipase atg15 [Marasmius tenuissimus]
MGVCNGISSGCATAGYAMESRCHLGKTIRYDTVGRLGWSSHVTNHGIKVVIDNVLNNETWDVPEPVPDEDDCWATECVSWTFDEGKESS